jgi:histidine triad (HIT) family protein
VDRDCIFCKIVKGEIPSYKVYEDDNFTAFLDINPLNQGHVQVVPKKHYRWTWDVPNFGEYWEVAKKVAKGQIDGLGAKMVEFLTHGTDVSHAHIWVVPIYENEVFINSSNRKKFDERAMSETAEKIKKSL